MLSGCKSWNSRCNNGLRSVHQSGVYRWGICKNMKILIRIVVVSDGNVCRSDVDMVSNGYSISCNEDSRLVNDCSRPFVSVRYICEKTEEDGG